MKRLALTLIAIIAAVSASNAQNITKSYTVKGFSSISASHAFDVEVTSGDKYAVTLDIPQSYLDYLVIEKNEGTLVLGFKKTLPKKLSNLRETCKAYITMPELRGIYLSGASKINVKDNVDIAMGKMEIEISGASKINGLTVKAPEVDIEVKGASKADINITTSKVEADVSGASKLVMTGIAGELELEVSGASSVNAKNAKADDVELDCSGASKAIVYAEKRLKVELSGASGCEYYAPEDIRLDIVGISGASSIHRAK